jgi:hypothetical protein
MYQKGAFKDVLLQRRCRENAERNYHPGEYIRVIKTAWEKLLPKRFYRKIVLVVNTIL